MRLTQRGEFLALYVGVPLATVAVSAIFAIFLWLIT